MRSEREREAAEFRAQGFEQAQRITAAADREATVIKAEADREASILRGQGEGRRTEILNEAYGQDPQFFDFYRSMQAYSAALDAESTYMVRSEEHTSELQSLMRISYAVFCLKKKNQTVTQRNQLNTYRTRTALSKSTKAIKNNSLT